MTAFRTLMLVSALADERFRHHVIEGVRPRPEYLRLEDEGVELLDWSQLSPPPRSRTWYGSTRHARAALRRMSDTDVVFSDGEQVGVPLALGMLATGFSVPHLVIGHRLTSPHKRLFFTTLKCHRAMSRIVVHSPHQLVQVNRILGLPADKLVLIPYYADENFWFPQLHVDEDDKLVVSAGREQRDYETLVRACSDSDIALHIADGSVHSPYAAHRQPRRWPANVWAGFASYVQLRDLYARASVVAVPLLENDFQAGVTTILEAMAMGKPVVVSATEGQSDVIEDGVTGVTVPPGDSESLGEVIRSLISSPSERRRLGRNAREAFAARFTLEHYAEALLNQMHLLGSGIPSEKFDQHPRRMTT